MKEIKAYIKPHKLSAVTLALHQVEGLTGMSVIESRGFGRSRAKSGPHRAADELTDFKPHVKIEIVCRDELAGRVVDVIQRNAHTGLRGDGMISITTVEDVVRIENGERGERAV